MCHNIANQNFSRIYRICVNLFFSLQNFSMISIFLMSIYLTCTSQFSITCIYLFTLLCYLLFLCLYSLFSSRSYSALFSSILTDAAWYLLYALSLFSLLLLLVVPLISFFYWDLFLLYCFFVFRGFCFCLLSFYDNFGLFRIFWYKIAKLFGGWVCVMGSKSSFCASHTQFIFI